MTPQPPRRPANEGVNAVFVVEGNSGASYARHQQTVDRLAGVSGQ